ncbi:MAG TPA: BspA family leucine-rich repeat surface protein, partial [Balneolaceae bacterium]|nr:BspA family leucine-rich repeat surface protein [Balneolaceae bacterium]
CNTASSPAKYQVNISAEPAEGGTVSPAGGEYEGGTSIDISAIASQGWRFVKWQGDYSGTSASAVITVERDMDITGIFEKKTYSLTINIEGEGSVDEKVIEAERTDYEHGTIVELTANASEGWKFIEWKGAATSADNPARIKLDEAKEVTAVFEKKNYPLTVKVKGRGAVDEQTIEAMSTDYPYQTQVKLTANSATGWKFTKWKGDLNSNENPAVITVDEPKTVTAVFEKKTFPLVIKVEGKGEVAREPDRQEYDYKTAVTLTAAPLEGWEFVKWKGGLDSTDNPAEIIMNAAKEVTAVFEKAQPQLTVEPASFEFSGSAGADTLAINNSGGGKLNWQITSDVNWLSFEPASGTDDGKVKIQYEENSAKDKRTAKITITSNGGTEEVAVKQTGKLFYLAKNGITIMCPEASIGQQGIVNGVTYTKRNKKQISKYNATTTCTSGITDMSNLFKRAYDFNRDISRWDVSNVTDMSYMFEMAYDFNQDISHWDVSGVKNMAGMFQQSRKFNQDISGWNVSKVTDMSYMFDRAYDFDQPIGSWDVGSAKTMQYMFNWADSFNQPLGNWNVSSVTNMEGMFRKAEVFNQPLENWDVSNVTTMLRMFASTPEFNGNIGSWNVGSVTNMEGMFYMANSFNQPIGNWDVSSVTDMSNLFSFAYRFNQPIGNWDVSNGPNMRQMFYGASDFNQPINNWDVSNVTNMAGLFGEADSFNQPLDNWDVSNVTNMSGMLGSSDFNQPVENWDVSNVTNMGGMFGRAESFNQSLNGWDVSNVTDMSGMFSGAKSFNQPLGNWDVSKVEDMGSMFRNAWRFNRSIGAWDVSSVTRMSLMFDNASDFDKAIGNWDVSKVEDMFGMFRRTYFNQDIGSWDVSNVTDMDSMFKDANSFKQDISGWCVSKIEKRPSWFFENSPLSHEPDFWPVWGTCPGN